MITFQDIINNPSLIRESMYEIIDRKYDVQVDVHQPDGDEDKLFIDIWIPAPEEFHSEDRYGGLIVLMKEWVEQSKVNVLEKELIRTKNQFRKYCPYFLNDETLLEKARSEARIEMRDALWKSKHKKD